jgi:hypothetical protein
MGLLRVVPTDAACGEDCVKVCLDDVEPRLALTNRRLRPRRRCRRQQKRRNPDPPPSIS